MENTAAHELYHQIGSDLEDASKGKMFGSECLKAPNGKALAIYYKGNMVFKLRDEAYNEAMALDGADLFNPGGKRPMNGWVELPYDYAEQWPHFAEEAMAYVRTIEKK